MKLELTNTNAKNIHRTTFNTKLSIKKQQQQPQQYNK